MFLARLVARNPNGTLDEIGAWYATDPCWAAKVAGASRRSRGRKMTKCIEIQMTEFSECYAMVDADKFKVGPISDLSGYPPGVKEPTASLL